MSRVTKYSTGFLAMALARRLLLVALLLTGLDFVHDGQVGWPRWCLPGLVSAPSDAGGTVREWLDRRRTPVPGERARTVEADLSGRVERVIDGDSLRVRIAGLGLTEVRLHGIDSPEYDQPFGRAARRELRRLVANRRVDLVSETVDSYGRLVATAYHGDLNVNREMVRRGYAWWYRRYAGFDLALRRAEQEAREQRRGLWRDEEPIPPWEWRHQ